MNQISENIKFGDMFITRDGRRAVCDGAPHFSVEGYSNKGMIYVDGDNDGTFLRPWLEFKPDGCLDIIDKLN